MCVFEESEIVLYESKGFLPGADGLSDLMVVALMCFYALDLGSDELGLMEGWFEFEEVEEVVVEDGGDGLSLPEPVEGVDQVKVDLLHSFIISIMIRVLIFLIVSITIN